MANIMAHLVKVTVEIEVPGRTVPDLAHVKLLLENVITEGFEQYHSSPNWETDPDDLKFAEEVCACHYKVTDLEMEVRPQDVTEAEEEERMVDEVYPPWW